MKREKKIERVRTNLAYYKEMVTPDHDHTGHWYLMGGKRMSSVTTALQMVKDDSIRNWKMNRALDHFIGELTKTFTLPSTEELEEIKQRAKDAPQREFVEAGDIGSAVHTLREIYVSEWLETGRRPGYALIELQKNAPEVFRNDPRVTSCLLALDKFYTQMGYEPVGCEMPVGHIPYNIAGSIDDLGFIKGSDDLFLMDLKTSNHGEKLSYWLQVITYAHLLQKMTRIRVDKINIVHVSKTDATYKLFPVPIKPELIRCALNIIKASNSVKEVERIMFDEKSLPVL